MTPAKLAELEEKAKASPEVVFQGGRESDRYYTAANPATILELVASHRKLEADLRKAVEALEWVQLKEECITPECKCKVCAALKELGVLPSVEVGDE